MTAEELTGLSTWERALYGHLMDHVKGEAAMVDRYDQLAINETGHVRFLLELIADEEVRHHALYQRWADTIKAQGVFAEPPDAVPDLVREADPTALMAAVDELIEFEKDDARQLRELDRELADVRKTTVWPLLVQLMEMDTQKHITVLRFLKDHARHTARHEHRGGVDVS